MKARMLTVSAARARILKGARPLPASSVALDCAAGRVLRETVKAPRAAPPFATSAMDGYAVRFADVANAPATLKVIGEAPAGTPYKGRVGKGAAVRIFTGGRVPDGADTVVIQENTTRKGYEVTVLDAPTKGANSRPKGGDFRKGERLLAAGRMLGPRDISLIAAANLGKVRVSRKPVVALVATGDELAAPGGRLKESAIINSNSPALAALLAAEGAEVLDLAIVRDQLGAIRRALKKAARADLIVTIGGASVGDYDFVQKAFLAEGGALDFWKITVKPGKPLMFGRLKGKPVIGLPGNPVSAFVTTWLFVLPLVRKKLGLKDILPGAVHGRAAVPLPPNKDRETYLLATLKPGPDGALLATPLPSQDSSHMKTLAQAECFILRKPFAWAALPGAPVVLYPLPGSRGSFS